jgi:hypothetical protein
MKNKSFLLGLMGVLLFLLSGCDPKYPPENIRVEKIYPLSLGETIEVKIIYPNEGGSMVVGWKDQKVDILTNNNVIFVSGLFITALEKGTATIKVSATTVLSEESFQSGNEDKVYTVQVKVYVK